MDHNQTTTSEDLAETDLDDDMEGIEFEGADGHDSLIEYNADSSNIETFFFFLLFPLRLLMHWTIPDVRDLDENGEVTATIGTAYASTIACLLWLIFGSYAMVASLEALGELMSIPDAVMGFTVSAAGTYFLFRTFTIMVWFVLGAHNLSAFVTTGTSLPNYVASKVAAENGFGNQAVSNAFGSNTFNIMCGLGLPWMLYISLGLGFEPYHGLKAEHIIDSILILFGCLGIFVAFMLESGFIIYRWHAIVFLLGYGGYLVYAILSGMEE